VPAAWRKLELPVGNSNDEPRRPTGKQEGRPWTDGRETCCKAQEGNRKLIGTQLENVLLAQEIAVSGKAKERLCAAFEQLEVIGFPVDQELRWYWDEAAEHFTSPTLWRVFGLAQILKREQPITVRGAFYRAVSAGLFPNTADEHYDCASRLILQMRRLGLVPYGYVVDSTRRRLKPSSWSGLADYAQTVAHAYRKDLWSRQPEYIEIFVEKDAMAAVIEKVTSEFDIHLNVIRGQVSETFVFDVSEVWKEIEKPVVAYYLGDHDPAGLAIEATLRRKLEKFGTPAASWERLAITPEDFANPGLLGFPVKKTFNKSGKPTGIWKPYVDEFGDRCIEVDALPAVEVRERIETAILSHVTRGSGNS
jgi:hypothetical protein